METQSSHRRLGLLTAFVALVGACPSLAAATAEELSVPSAAGEKTHSLFMGADISVELDKAFHRVRDVSRSSWVVTVNGRPEFIPTVQRRLNLRVEQSLKLSHRKATVIDFKAERTYTLGNDPKQQAITAQNQMSALTTERTMVAERELSRAVEALSWPAASPLEPRDNPFSSKGPQATYGMERVESALSGLQGASTLAAGELTGNSFHDGIAEEQLKKENYDAIAIEFDIASEKPLQNPYLVVIAQFREKDEAPKLARNWIYAESLDPIDEKPQKIRLLRGGFPWGYILDKVQVHIYNEGTEVATNLSPKHVPLTSEEAFQYLVIEHIGTNKGKTVPASPAMANLPAEVRTRLRSGEGQPTYYVVVSKDGKVTDAFEDEDHAHRVKDPFFDDAVKRVWFKPALESGKPVEAKASVNIAQLAL